MKTKAVINGKLYDASLSREIAKIGGEALHAKRGGELFTSGDGGIKLISLEEAKAWIETRLDGIEKKDALAKLPRHKLMEPKKFVKSYLTPEELARLVALRESRGFGNADVLAAGIEALEKGLL